MSLDRAGVAALLDHTLLKPEATRTQVEALMLEAARGSEAVVASPAPFVLMRALGDYGIDPIVAGLLLMPPFFLIGMATYRIYYETFERRGSDAGVRGIAFFVGPQCVG